MPGCLSEAISSGQGEPLCGEDRGHFAGRTYLEKGAEDQQEALLHFSIRVFLHHAALVADQPYGQLQRQLPSLGFLEESSRQSGFEGMQFQLGDLPFQAQQQTAVSTRRVVDAVAVGDETAGKAAQVEERIPVGAVARQARDLNGEDETDLASGDLGHQILKSSPLRRGRWVTSRKPALVIAGGVLCAILCAQAVRTLQAHDEALSFSTVARHRADWYPEDAMPRPPRPGCDVAMASEPMGEGSAWTFTRTGCGANPAGPRLFVAGDSHATAYVALLRQYAMDTGVEVRVYQSPGCRFFGLGMAREFEDPGCLPSMDAAMADIARRARRGDVLFLPSLRLERFSDQWVAFDRNEAMARNLGEAAQAARRDGIAHALRRLSPLARGGLRVVFEAPTPLFPAPAYRCSDDFNRDNPICDGGLEMPRRELDAYRMPVLRAMQALVAKLPHATVWDPLPLLCPDVTCRAVEGGRPLFFDGDHLSGYGNRLLLPDFARHLQSLRDPARVTPGRNPGSMPASVPPAQG